MISRRALLSATTAVAVFSALASGACTPGKKATRCAHCGMKLDPESAWRSELNGENADHPGEPKRYDTPRCAFTEWRKAPTKASAIRLLDYYDRAPRDGTELRFVVGSDVLGPMGPDLVPVTPERVGKFVKDHGGRALALADVTLQLLEDPK